MITEDDDVLACGSNKYKCLGFGDDDGYLFPRSITELRNNNVKGNVVLNLKFFYSIIPYE